MTTVPVLWVSLHDDVLARGYADQGLIEAMFDRTLWRPPCALDFDHREVRDVLPEVEGAVVVIPYRHHYEDTERLRAWLDGMEWVVLMLVGDEEWTGPWRDLMHHRNARVWIMQPQPEHAEYASVLLPCGWYPGTRAGIAAERDERSPRTLDWFFGGQVTHPRRQELARVLRRMLKLRGARGRLIETEGYLQGVPPAEYFALLADAKVLPCPSGPKSVCTARAEEALEAGGVPVLDLVKPEDPQFDYWRLLWPDHALRTLTSWGELHHVLDRLDWPGEATRAWAWWQQQKRRYAYALDEDVRAVAPHLPGAHGSPDDLITVIVTTSPVTLHPSTEHVETTIDSVRAQLPDAEIIVVADGVRPEQEYLHDCYAEYLHRLCWLTNFRWHNVVPLLLDDWQHQAGAVRAALELVTTPLVLLVEHDTPLKEYPIQWDALCTLVESGEANSVRFHHEDHIHDEHQALMVDHSTRLVAPLGADGTRGVGTLPLRRTMTWWQRPHLASTRFYRERILPMFPPDSRAFIEDHVYGVVASAFVDHGESAWWDWRLFVYTPEGTMQRSWHLDSRGEEQKYSMRLPGKGWS